MIPGEGFMQDLGVRGARSLPTQLVRGAADLSEKEEFRGETRARARAVHGCTTFQGAKTIHVECIE